MSGCGSRCHPHCGDVVAGDTFVGTFSLVDPSILNGIGSVLATVAHFNLTIGGITWSQDFPHQIDFSGGAFVGFHVGPPSFVSLTQIPVVVKGGEITTFGNGGVFGHSDEPYVDFHPDSTFIAFDDERSGISGTYVLRAVVPEPPSLTIIMLGFVGMGLLRLRRSM
jgi:hypothetical protein